MESSAQPPSSMRVKISRQVALWGNLSLIALVILWHSFLSPHPHINPYALTIAWVIPLLFPLRGILAGKPYTHAWANFVLMFYFLHALTLVYVDEGERWLAAFELLITSITFIGNGFYARLKGKELGLKLDRLSSVEKKEKETYSPK